MTITFREDPDRRTWTKEQVLAALAEKRGDETLYHAVRRLERTGALPGIRPPAPPKALLRAVAVREALHARGVNLGDGALAELEQAAMVLVEFAYRSARLNHRKTVTPADVNGNALNWALKLRRK